MSTRRPPALDAAAALLVASLVSTWARADGSTAQAQFDYGLSEMEAGRYESGCPALADSYRTDPHPGALFTLAECESKWGKIASALTHYEAYLDLFDHMSAEQKVHQRGRDRVSTAQRDRLRVEVPRLSIALPPEAPAGTSVTRDGVPVGAPSLGVPLTVDPGVHVLAARTPDGVAHELRVTLRPGEQLNIVVDLSAATVPAPLPRASSGAASPARESPSSSGPQEAPARGPAEATGPLRSGQGLRSAAWVAGGIGIAALVLGAGPGAVVLGDKATIDAHCRSDDTCDAQGLSAADQARTLGAVSTAGFVVGGVAIATALVLLVASSTHHPPRSGASAWTPVGVAGPGGEFVGLRGTW